MCAGLRRGRGEGGGRGLGRRGKVWGGGDNGREMSAGTASVYQYVP